MVELIPDKASLERAAIREASLGDYQLIAALERKHGHQTRDRDAWLSRWLDNPLYRTMPRHWPAGWVLEDGGRLVGWCGNVPVEYTFRGRPVIAAKACGWCLEPGYRRFAGALVQPFFEQGADLMIGPDDTTAALAAGKSGAGRPPAGSWDTAPFFVADYAGFAGVALRAKGLPAPGPVRALAGAGLWAKDRLGAEAVPAGAPGLSMVEASRFGPGFDQFWDRWTRRYTGKLAAVRTGAMLEWRFQCLTGGTAPRRLAALRGGAIAAYAILHRHDDPASGLTRYRIADYRSLDPDPAVLAAVLREAIGLCGQEGVHVLESPAARLPGMEALDRWAPYRRRLAAWNFLYKCGDPRLAEALRDPAAWSPTAYDGPLGPGRVSPCGPARSSTRREFSGAAA